MSRRHKRIRRLVRDAVREHEASAAPLSTLFPQLAALKTTEKELRRAVGVIGRKQARRAVRQETVTAAVAEAVASAQ